MRFKWKKYRKIKFKPLHPNFDLKVKYFQVLQCIIVAILVFISFVVLCNGFYVKPNLLIPIAMSLAIFFEDEVKSAIVGGLCGMLIDFSCYKIFGFNAVVLLVGCVLTTLLFKNYLKPLFINGLICIGTFTFVHGFVDYFFYYKMWYSSVSSVVYMNYTLPSCIMTVASVVVVYPLIKAIRLKLVAK